MSADILMLADRGRDTLQLLARVFLLFWLFNAIFPSHMYIRLLGLHDVTNPFVSNKSCDRFETHDTVGNVIQVMNAEGRLKGVFVA